MFPKPPASPNPPGPERRVDFAYQDEVYEPDLLNYKEMNLTMNRWASTGTGWQSVIAVIAIGLLCFAASLLLAVIRIAQTVTP